MKPAPPVTRIVDPFVMSGLSSCAGATGKMASAHQPRTVNA
jgi:hypothetical protein